MSIDANLILAEAEQVQGIPLTAARAAEIAADVESMVAGLARVADAIGFFDEPDGLRAVLWELREARTDER